MFKAILETQLAAELNRHNQQVSHIFKYSCTFIIFSSIQLYPLSVGSFHCFSSSCIACWKPCLVVFCSGCLTKDRAKERDSKALHDHDQSWYSWIANGLHVLVLLKANQMPARWTCQVRIWIFGMYSQVSFWHHLKLRHICPKIKNTPPRKQ